MPSVCSSTIPSGKVHVAIEDANVIQSQESAFKDIIILRVFAIDPPGEINQQPVKYALQRNQYHLSPLCLSRLYKCHADQA